jgi:hypothetical protein
LREPGENLFDLRPGDWSEIMNRNDQEALHEGSVAGSDRGTSANYVVVLEGSAPSLRSNDRSARRASKAWDVGTDCATPFSAQAERPAARRLSRCGGAIERNASPNDQAARSGVVPVTIVPLNFG